MTPPSKTRHGPKKLSDVARHICQPSGIVSTGWPAVHQRLKTFRIPFDLWQEGAGRLILAKRDDGVYAAGVGGAVLSIPRQVGKTYMIGWIVFALCTITPNTTAIWTAHRLRTSNETFGKMLAMARKPSVAPYIETVRVANGEGAIYFRNGSRILFGARDRGFGLGFDKVDILVLDEAQRVREAAMNDMVPATNAAPNGLVIMMGTPPRPTDDGEVFTNRRKDALDGDRDTLYIELSADENADVNDRAQWRKANPSYPTRTPEHSMLRMRKLLGSDESFTREGLGIWDTVSPRALIKPSTWGELVTEAPPIEGIVAVGVKFSADGERISVGVAVNPDDGPVCVASLSVAPMATGVGQALEWIGKRWPSIDQIVLDGLSGAGEAKLSLREAGVPAKRIKVLTTPEAVTAHAGFLRDVHESNLRHTGQPGLDDQVRHAMRRAIGTNGGWGWKATSALHDVTALDAVTLARHGAVTTNRKSKTRTRRNGREAIVA